MSSNNDILSAALQYATIGLPVIPVRGKKPFLKDWPDLATTDPMQIEKWFGNDPGLNVSIVTGGDFFVIDIDGKKGIANLAELQKEHGELPRTVRARTGGGGEHWFFLVPPDRTIGNRTEVQGLKIDVRGEKGQVVAPPSLHENGNLYEWINSPSDCEIAEAPEWLLDFIDKPKSTITIATVEGNLAHELGASRDLKTDPGATEGTRHDRALQLVGIHLARGESSLELLAIALAWADRCRPPMDRDEMIRILLDLDKKEREKNGVSTQQIAWPTLDETARYGLAGDLVERLEPETESDPVALLIQILAYFGSIIGRTAHFVADGAEHYGNLFTVLVGETSKGRKGTSEKRISRLFLSEFPDFKNRRQSGLSSGEGLISSVRDPGWTSVPREGKKGYRKEQDKGVKDKRLLVVESEFASVLRLIRREGNILSEVIRQAWDGGELRTMTRHNPLRASSTHISIIGHITKEELKRSISDTENFNGFSNRFIWVGVKRSKLLPEGGVDIYPADLALKLKESVEFARNVGQLHRDEAAKKLWKEIYERLSHSPQGLLGAVTDRAEPQIMRLSMLFALIDQSTIVRVEHLRAAEALWQYSFDSAQYVFGSALGDPLADKVLGIIRSQSSVTKTELHAGLSGHVKAKDLDRALGILISRKLISFASRKSAGRTAEVYTIISS